MSFSSEVKEELSKLNNLANKEIVKYELLGYLSSNHITIEKNKMKFLTENEYNINRFAKILSNLKYCNYEIEMSGKNFCITLPKIQLKETKDDTLNLQVIWQEIKKNELLAKAFIRGVFLGSGSINNPKITYHLEIIFSTKQNAQMVLKILEQYHIYFKILKKKNNYAIYTKDGEEISKFLALIQASKSVLKFEDIRVFRNVRNQVNRKVNCETANLNKTVNAALEQIQNIQYLQKVGEFKNLSKPLQEIANLRLENPDASLIELGNLLQKPIGKSGVNHRFQAIQKMVEERKKK